VPRGAPIRLQELQDVAGLDAEVARQLLNLDATGLGSDTNSSV
jgi:hypothetical protein